jgi:uncharacterized membrane protein
LLPDGIGRAAEKGRRMFETENGTWAEIETPAAKKARGEPQPYKSNFAAAVTIDRSPEELYNFWSNFGNLAKVMENIRSVTMMEGGRSHWVVQGPTGLLEWDAELVEDVPNRRLAWRSVGDADIDNAGVVEFKEGPPGRGTEVRVLISFKAPGGVVGRTIAAFLERDPHVQARRDLRRFKQLMETGEIATASGTGNATIKQPKS